MEYEIIDNFLSKKEFTLLKKEILSSAVWWDYSESINDNDESDMKIFNRYFTHHFLYNNSYSKTIHLIRPILEKLPIKQLLRIKANLFPSTENLKEYAFHSDQNFKHKGAIFYINTCNGFTILEDGTRIESVSNRMLLFDSSKPHASTNCTDQPSRINININYL